jgi:hypothetical protein
MVTRRGLMIGGGVALLGFGGAAWAARRQMGSMAEYEAAVAAQRAAAAVPGEVRDLISYATMAPNGHNTQAWRFRVQPNQIAILPDFTRRTPVVDPDDHHIFVSLGAAAETLAIAAAAGGKAGEITFDPTADGAVLFTFGSAKAAEQALFDSIPHRQSTRADYDGTAVSASDLALLAKAATVPGVDLVLVTDRPKMTSLGDLVISGNTAQIGDKAFVTELKHWLRFSPNRALATGDGLFSASSGNPALPEWMGPLLFDMVYTVKAETKKYAGQIATSAGLAVFSGAKADPAHWVQVGRSCQRFALQATALGLTCSFLNQPVEVPALRADLAALIGLPGRRPDLVLRFGRGAALPFSARRPVEAVMV